MVAKADLLKAALETVEKRGLTYGTPENNFARIAHLWQYYLSAREQPSSPCDGDIVVTETDVAAMMALMKIARLMEKPGHYDSWLDLAGYAACGAEVSGAVAPDQPIPARLARAMGWSREAATGQGETAMPIEARGHWNESTVPKWPIVQQTNRTNMPDDGA